MVKGTTATVETGRKSGKLFRKQEEVQSKRAHAVQADAAFFSAEGSFFRGVQSKCAECESEGEVQAKFIPAIQRVEASDDIQRQPETGVEEEVQRAAQEPEIQSKCADCAQEEAEPAATNPVQRSPEEEDTELQRLPEEVQEKPQVQTACAECAAEPTSATATPASLVPDGVQASLKVGAPNDRYEQEADQMGERVMRMPDTQFSSGEGIVPSDTGNSIRRQEEDEPAEVQGKTLQRTPGLQRTPSGGLQTTTGFAGRLQSSLSGGSALGAPVQQGMESAFNADFSRVQIHTGPTAAALSNEIGAKAFTYQNHVFFNEGNYQPETQSGRFLLAHELTHTVQQGAAVKRSEASAPDVQASWFDDALSWLSGFADNIPGYALLKVLIGQDIFTGQSVPMTAENLIRGIFGLLGPLGLLVYDKLAEYQIIQDAFTWLRGQLRTLNITMSRIRETIQAAWDELPVLNIPGLLYRHFNPLVDDIRTFASNTVDQVIQLLKDALVSVLKAMAIDRLPAYRLLTKILHRDPLTGEEVPATTVEILEDFLRMINANDELEQMRERGTLQKTADWIDAQMGQFMSLMDELGGIFQRIWALFSLETLRDITGKLEEIITAFTSFVQRVFTFASNVAITVLQFIKDSLLNWLRTHANGIRGYRLMTVLLGKDPVTDQVVERNARNILSGFVELVAGPEKFQEIEQSGAIERMAAWLEGLITRTGITIQMVIDLFVGIWNSLTIQDLIHPLDAFERVITKFRDPIQRVLTFIVEVIKKVVEIVLQLMNFPSDLIAQILQRAMAAIEDIQRDPLGFLKNILGAAKLGFQQFFGNIGTHLLNGLTGWLFGELQQAGIRPPQDFTLGSVVGFVFEVLNISMERIWQKLAEHPQIGPERVARVRQFIETASGAVEGAWAFIQDIQREGIGAIWRHLQEQLANLWNTVLESVQNWVMEQVVNQMVARLLSMLDPTGIMAIINSAIAFYRAVQSFIERLREILEVINSFVGGIAEIARGSLATAANFLESSMGRAMPVVIGFLANQVGLRGLGARIGDMVGRVREMVDQGLTWLVNKAVTMGRRLLDRVMGRGGDETINSEENQNETNDGSVKGLAIERFKNLAQNVQSIDALKSIAANVKGEFLSQGLKEFDLKIENSQTLNITVIAKASPAVEIDISFERVFRREDLDDSRIQRIRKLFLTPDRSKTNASITVNGALIASRNSTSRGHAEENLINSGKWNEALIAANFAAQAMESNGRQGSIELVFLVNRSPCSDKCASPLLIEKIRSAKLRGHRFIKYILATNRLYSPTRPMTPEEQIIRQDLIMKNPEARSILERKTVMDESATEAVDAQNLASAGWDLRFLDLGDSRTESQDLWRITVEEVKRELATKFNQEL